MEAGGDLLVVGGGRQQVARQLLGGELVERHVAVQGVDHPVAVLPDRARAVNAVAVGVGVAGGVEPVLAPPLAVVRAGEQAVDLLLVGVGGPVIQELVQFLRSRRQAGQVQADAAQERGLWRFGRRLDPFLFESREDEPVDRVAAPGRVAHRGFGRTGGFL